jgi:D-beta-D-heptose 7-phosphate kinase/D-beta-D-heptose 1-phosphate adenosyltransferase
MTSGFNATIDRFGALRVLVIGEMILDSYLRGSTDRLCREAPVPTVKVETETVAPGGAANTALNLAGLGAQVTFLSVGGQDAEARRVLDRLEAAGVDAGHLLLDPARQTLAKKRVVAGSQLLVRFDYGTTSAVSGPMERALVARVIERFPDHDAVVLSDYGYGIFTPAVVEALRRLQRSGPLCLLADSKNLRRFAALGVTAVKPNYDEALRLLSLAPVPPARRAEQVMEAGADLLAATGARLAAVTLDAAGSVVLERGRTPLRTYARPVESSRTAGAGDTYLSALALALAAGAPAAEAAELAQAAADVVVNKDGTAVCARHELRDCFAPPGKVIHSRADLAARCRAWREQGRRVVFTNGCFDILHTGHIAYLADARAQGDVLVVGVNTDESVRRLKGPERPINRLADRMQVLAALNTVDLVAPFGEDTPSELIRAVRPAIFVKGGDYSREQLPEAAVVEALGGEVRLLRYVASYSTTNLINKIRAAEALAGQPADGR